jgi:hypothetical protein
MFELTKSELVVIKRAVCGEKNIQNLKNCKDVEK